MHSGAVTMAALSAIMEDPPAVVMSTPSSLEAIDGGWCKALSFCFNFSFRLMLSTIPYTLISSALSLFTAASVLDLSFDSLAAFLLLLELERELLLLRPMTPTLSGPLPKPNILLPTLPLYTLNSNIFNYLKLNQFSSPGVLGFWGFGVLG